MLRPKTPSRKSSESAMWLPHEISRLLFLMASNVGAHYRTRRLARTAELDSRTRRKSEPGVKEGCMMSHSVSYTKEDDIGIITVTNPPVNALSQHVRQGLAERFGRSRQRQHHRNGSHLRRAGPLSPARTLPNSANRSSRRIFLTPWRSSRTSPSRLWLPSTARPWRRLETALCCHYRVALPSARVGAA